MKFSRNLFSPILSSSPASALARLPRLAAPAVFSLTVITLLGTHSAQAVTKTWDAGAAASDWSTANNWNTNGVPAAADDVLFDNSSQATLENVYLNAAQSINSLTLGMTNNQAWSLGADNNTNPFTLALATGNITDGSPRCVGAPGGKGGLHPAKFASLAGWFLDSDLCRVAEVLLSVASNFW
jgi:hypothetical protein